MGLLHSGNSTKNTCPSIPTGPQYGADHIVGSFTFHKLTILLCGTFTAATFFLSGIQLLLHATHFSNPGQQTQILRIIFLVPTFALVFFLAGSIPSAAIYLQPWANAYEAVALASYFLLLVTYTVPDPRLRDSYFDRLQQPGSAEGSLRWYHRTWCFVFQYIPISIIVAVATDITQAAGKYCINGNSVHFAHIWLTIIRAISVTVAFLRLLRFYLRLRPSLAPHAVIPKLVAIKALVFLTVLQNIIFTILSSTNTAKPSPTLSYNDIYYGIPAILTCGEMVFFSLFTFYAYSFRPYTLSPAKPPATEYRPSSIESVPHYRGGFMGINALLTAMNPSEIIHGLVLAVRYLLSRPGPQGRNSLPLQQSGALPSYIPHASAGQAHGAKPVEYGRVDRYTPLPN